MIGVHDAPSGDPAQCKTSKLHLLSPIRGHTALQQKRPGAGEMQWGIARLGNFKTTLAKSRKTQHSVSYPWSGLLQNL
jgi:hypothetical protein